MAEEEFRGAQERLMKSMYKGTEKHKLSPANQPAAAVKKFKSAGSCGGRVVKAVLCSQLQPLQCRCPGSVHLPVHKPRHGWAGLCGPGWGVAWLSLCRRLGWAPGNSCGVVTAGGTAQGNCCSPTAGGSHSCLLCVPALYRSCKRHGENSPKRMLKGVLRLTFKYTISIL